MTPKIAAISMVNDECDIIELFVRINSRSVDHIYILDHNSNDGTKEILDHLKKEGFPITTRNFDVFEFVQAEALTSAAKAIAKTGQYTHIIPLDADEFIHMGNIDLKETIGEIPQGFCGALPWVTYVPLIDDYYNSSAPLYENFRMRSIEPHQFYKVIVPVDLVPKCNLTFGSHSCLEAGTSQVIPQHVLPTLLQHVPVRTSEQILSKALLGTHKLSIKPGRTKKQAFHWDLMAELGRKRNYKLSHQDVIQIALEYSTPASVSTKAEISDDGAPRIGNLDDKITLKDLARVNVVKNLDNFIGQLCDKVKKTAFNPNFQRFY